MRVFAIPMRVRFRGITRREGVLFAGPAGWAEFSPFAEYGPAESARWLTAAREAAYDGWPPPLRDRVPVNCTIPAVSPERAYQLVRASGCGTAKVKVAEAGQSMLHDLARLAAVRDALGPPGRIRIDANGAWDPSTATRLIKEFAKFDLEYVEQPCATLDDLAAVRRRVDVPIAVDESIRRAEDPLRVSAAEAADVVVLKVQPLGGVRNALRVAERCGLPAVVSSAVETSIGLAAGLALAAALPALPYACGLATAWMLDGDVVADPLLPANGEITVRRPVVDEAALARYEVDSATWRRRVADAQALMDAPPIFGTVRGAS